MEGYRVWEGSKCQLERRNFREQRQEGEKMRERWNWARRKYEEGEGGGQDVGKETRMAAGKWIGRQMGKWVGFQVCERVGRQMNKWVGGQMDKLVDRLMDKCVDGQRGKRVDG